MKSRKMVDKSVCRVGTGMQTQRDMWAWWWGGERARGR